MSAHKMATVQNPVSRSVTVLGCTGSVGCNTVDLLNRNPDAYRVEALVANRNVSRLIDQAKALHPALAVVADETAYEALKTGLAGTGIEVASGRQAVIDAAKRPADWVISAIVGAAGLEPTMAAVERGAVIGLANKESLVCAGTLMTAAVKRSGSVLLPVDSEHSAIFQVLDYDHPEGIEKIILTASGGPFRTWDRAAMAAVTPAQAVAHPNWSMGAKISVDSATMMNKGLELIEAHHLFSMPEDRIDILVHPQSVIHSMVSYVDGSVLAQLGSPDMRTPIAVALAWPTRMETPTPRLDLAQIGQLTFESPDAERFPALSVVRGALQSGGAAPTIMNAANEVAVAHFLNGTLGFLQIVDVVKATLDALGAPAMGSLDDLMHFDSEARRQAAVICQGFARRAG